jgi:hypothetical protein
MDLARFLFDRQAKTYIDDSEHAARMWEGNEGVREFWISEAEAIVEFLMPAVTE